MLRHKTGFLVINQDLFNFTIWRSCFVYLQNQCGSFDPKKHYHKTSVNDVQRFGRAVTPTSYFRLY